MTPDKLSQVVSGSLLPEPVHEPARLMSHQNNLIIRAHSFFSYPGKIPAKQLWLLSHMLAVAPLSPVKIYSGINKSNKSFFLECSGSDLTFLAFIFDIAPQPQKAIS